MELADVATALTAAAAAPETLVPTLTPLAGPVLCTREVALW